MAKINWKPVGEFAGDLCKIVGYGLALVLPHAIVGYVSSKNDTTTVTANYSGAVEAIMKSDMMSSYKQEAINALKTDGSIDYYKAVIHVVYSSAMSSYKVNMIRDLSSK